MEHLSCHLVACNFNGHRALDNCIPNTSLLEHPAQSHRKIKAASLAKLPANLSNLPRDHLDQLRCMLKVLLAVGTRFYEACVGLQEKWIYAFLAEKYFGIIEARDR